MKQLLSEMAASADPGFWVAVAVVLVPYAVGVALLVFQRLIVVVSRAAWNRRAESVWRYFQDSPRRSA
ncbi:hypothetical protein [Mesorhizobium muleiense]|uniref:hypothetical protein n=1 Tax=Mesorhizobium muleiense TaxID=1004279 RepID=UPI001F235C7C|nr:hypothetical protein [Mesorhizobium muleiense]MCF6111654.1 hypothetical protein [Mesorhizobium muleiense]